MSGKLPERAARQMELSDRMRALNENLRKSGGGGELRNGRGVARPDQATRTRDGELDDEIRPTSCRAPANGCAARDRITRSWSAAASGWRAICGTVLFPAGRKRRSGPQILELIKPRVEELPEMQDSFSELLQDLSALEKQVLVERHLISREHAAKSVGSAVVMNRKQTLSIMINEEDHLRMQSIRSGLQLKQRLQAGRQSRQRARRRNSISPTTRSSVT